MLLYCVRFRFSSNDANLNINFNVKRLCTTCTIGEMGNGMDHTLASIASTSG